jgi:hypothetical protein
MPIDSILITISGKSCIFNPPFFFSFTLRALNSKRPCEKKEEIGREWMSEWVREEKI